MRWFPKRRQARPGTLRTSSSDDLAHLAEFVKTHSGVEAFLEPRTAVTDTTVVLVAGTGEWTRRRIDGFSGASSFAKKHAIPLYDAGNVGYPRRMRAWTEHHKAGQSGQPARPGRAASAGDRGDPA